MKVTFVATYDRKMSNLSLRRLRMYAEALA